MPPPSPNETYSAPFRSELELAAVLVRSSECGIARIGFADQGAGDMAGKESTWMSPACVPAASSPV